MAAGDNTVGKRLLGQKNVPVVTVGELMIIACSTAMLVWGGKQALTLASW